MDLFEELRLGLLQAIEEEKMMIKLSDRKKIVDRYEKWFEEVNKQNNNTLANNSLTFMVFLITEKLLDMDRVKEYLEEN